MASLAASREKDDTLKNAFENQWYVQVCKFCLLFGTSVDIYTKRQWMILVIIVKAQE